MRVVVALGGNALAPPGASTQEQRELVRVACGQLLELLAAGHQLVVTHGNGPQVGRLLDLHRAAGDDSPDLAMLVGQTQASIGLLVAQELSAMLHDTGLTAPVVSVLTQVVVEREDPAFAWPDKPVGPHHTETELEFLLGSPVPADGGRWSAGSAVYAKTEHASWRRVVGSPRPLEIVEDGTLRLLVDAGIIPICGGGGGVPVVRDAGQLRPVDAVVDKDRTAALLARVLGADALLILTAVDGLRQDFGTAEERRIDELGTVQARRLLDAGALPAGSIAPKVEAAATAAEHGMLAVIGALERAVDSLEGRAGTRVVPDAAAQPG